MPPNLPPSHPAPPTPAPPLPAQLLVATTQLLGGEAGREARKRTPRDLPGARLPDGCRQRLHFRFGDVATHNDAGAPYTFTRKEVSKAGQVEEVKVELQGRLPSSWDGAFADHAWLLKAQGSSGHLVAMHTVGCAGLDLPAAMPAAGGQPSPPCFQPASNQHPAVPPHVSSLKGLPRLPPPPPACLLRLPPRRARRAWSSGRSRRRWALPALT